MTSLLSRFSFPFLNNSYQRLPVTENDGNIPSNQTRQTEASIYTVFVTIAHVQHYLC